jgi:prepilin-type N-terminal cleavage/methylation domain-containing protein
MKKGFTLIELLAVIVILAIILVIAVPQILKVIESSKIDSLESSAKLVAKSVEQNVIQDVSQPTEIDCMTGYGLNSNDYASCTATVSYGDTTIIVSVDIVGAGKFAGLLVGSTSETSHVIETADTQNLSAALLATVNGKDIDVDKYAGNGLYIWGDKYIYRGGITKTNANGLATADYLTDVDSGMEVNNYIQVPWEDYSIYTDCVDGLNNCYRIMEINEDESITIIRDKSLSNQRFDNSPNTYARTFYSNYTTTYGYNDLLSNSYTEYEDDYRPYSEMYTYLYGDSGYDATTIKPYSSILQPLDLCLNKAESYAGINNNSYATTGYVTDTCNVTGKANTIAVSSLKNKYIRTPYIEEYLNASIESTCTTDHQYQCRNQNYLYNKTSYWALNGRSSFTWHIRYVHANGGATHTTAYFLSNVRPVVTLKSNVLITGGSGTQANPYVIKW